MYHDYLRLSNAFCENFTEQPASLPEKCDFKIPLVRFLLWSEHGSAILSRHEKVYMYRVTCARPRFVCRGRRWFVSEFVLYMCSGSVTAGMADLAVFGKLPIFFGFFWFFLVFGLTRGGFGCILYDVGLEKGRCSPQIRICDESFG